MTLFAVVVAWENGYTLPWYVGAAIAADVFLMLPGFILNMLAFGRWIMGA